MDLINVATPDGERRERFFARSAGTTFDIRAAGDITEIDIYDEIGFWGVNAKDFRARLKDSGDVILNINSPGGDVFDGIAMFNDLVAHKGNVTVNVTGIAASIASIIAMGGDTINIAPNAFFMIHNAWTVGIGNRNDFGKLADTLAKIDDALARTYAAKTGSGIKAVKAMMDAETWLTAKEAKEAGFASAIGSDTAPKAKFDLSVFAEVPKSLFWASDDDESEAPTIRDLERVLMRDAGKSRTKARALIAAAKSENNAKQDAGGVQLKELAAAFESARAAFPKFIK